LTGNASSRSRQHRPENSQPDPGRKISIADATLPENLSRINRALIENFPAAIIIAIFFLDSD
jgi:hypothetical protein